MYKHTNNFYKKNKKSIYQTISSLVLMVSLLGIMVPSVFAAQLAYKSDTMTRQKKNTEATHTIDFLIPDNMTTGFSITFPNGFDLGNIDYSDMSFDFSDNGQTSCPQHLIQVQII